MYKNKLLNNLFGDELTTVMYEMLDEFRDLDYDDDQIFKILKPCNEAVRTGFYLLSLENNLDNISYRINRVNKKINLIRRDDFLDAYKNKTVDKFLSTLGKSDKISLMSDLGVDVPLEDRLKLSELDLEYYRIISNSVMEDQANEYRDGLDTFIKYKKENKDTQ